MTTFADLLDDLRDRLDDSGDTVISKARKQRWINRGIAALWPEVWVPVSDASAATYTEGTYTYVLPVAFAGSIVHRVRCFVSGSTGQSFLVQGWQCRRTVGAPTLEVVSGSGVGGAKLLVDAVRPVKQLVLDADAYDGPFETIELPVLYAMSVAAGRGLDGRLDYTRYSTRNGQNGVGPAEVEGAANYFMGLFREGLGANAMAMPPVVG